MISKEEGKIVIDQWLSKRKLHCQLEQTETSLTNSESPERRLTLRFDQTSLLIPVEESKEYYDYFDLNKDLKKVKENQQFTLRCFGHPNSIVLFKNFRLNTIHLHITNQKEFDWCCQEDLRLTIPLQVYLTFIPQSFSQQTKNQLNCHFPLCLKVKSGDISRGYSVLVKNAIVIV